MSKEGGEGGGLHYCLFLFYICQAKTMNGSIGRRFMSEISTPPALTRYIQVNNGKSDATIYSLFFNNHDDDDDNDDDDELNTCDSFSQICSIFSSTTQQV